MMQRISLSNYSDVYILMKGYVTITDAVARQLDKRIGQIAFKNLEPFTDCISKINNTPADNTKDLEVVMPMDNLIDHINNYEAIIYGSITRMIQMIR